MHPRRHFFTVIAAAAVVAMFSTAASAGDLYYDIPLDKLKVTSGEFPRAEGDNNLSIRFDPRWQAMQPHVALDGGGEGFLNLQSDFFWRNYPGAAKEMTDAHLFVHVPNDQPVAGQLTMPVMAGKEMKLVKFSIDPSDATDAAHEPFLEAKIQRYNQLINQSVAGSAWFRHEMLAAQQELVKLNPERKSVQPAGGPPFGGGRDRIDAYDLFSGGRAISENLQLDRNLRETPKAEEPNIDIGTLKGITVAQIDWKPLLKDAKPKLDPLAKLIPFDQHAVFFPTFNDAVKLADEANGKGAGWTVIAQSRAEDAGVLKRYEQQMGLSLNGLGRIVGPAIVRSVAVTGSDPYFPMGTDVAVLFETDNPTALAALLSTQIQMAASKFPDAKRQSGETAGLKYKAIRTPDRQLSSYVATLNGAVMVTNSSAQLERLAKVGKEIDPISSLDEFKFFRTRYPLSDKTETAFLFLSDATIRRWCSPRWRIASARRIFTAAELAEQTALHADELAAGKVQPGTLHSDTPLVDAGELSISNAGVVSSTQGSLAFMTPIVELPIEKVTKTEADAYNQWRDGYQRNWRWAFDPIGLRIGVLNDKLAADLTVMPLIANSEYQQFISISRGAAIAPEANDRHDALAHLAVAINFKSEPIRGWSNMASAFAPQLRVDPFGWLGESVSVYFDDDPLWDKLKAMTPEEKEKFYEHGWHELPVAIQAEVSSPLKLTAFLTALRAFVEQTAPGMVEWESLKYHDRAYVRVRPTEQARKGMGEEGEVTIYYAPGVSGITFTLNENVMKHAIDRQIERDKAGNPDSGEKKSAASGTGLANLPWLGSSVSFQVDRKMLDALFSTQWDFFDGPDAVSQSGLQLRAWNNIPILNEWKRLFPADDPLAVHERLWHVRLGGPETGEYAWNDEWKTMESTTFGHPGQPKTVAEPADIFGRIQTANFGLTFEDQGLRGRIELNRRPPAAAKR